MTIRRAAMLGLMSLLCGLLTLATTYGADAKPGHHAHHHHSSHGKATVSIGDVDVTETDAPGEAVLTVTLKKKAGQKVTVWWKTDNGTATAPADYTASSGKLVFRGKKRNQSQQIAVTVAGDNVAEPNETFTVDIVKVKHAKLSDGVGTATIHDDETAGPVPIMRTLTVTRAGTGTGVVKSSGGTLSCPPTCSIQVPDGNYVTLNETPDAGSTFVSWTGGCLISRVGCRIRMTANRTVTATFNSQITPHLDYQASANYGEANLSAGFSPDPYSVGMTTGGAPVDVSYLGASCHGFATIHPDLRVNFGGGGASLLRTYFVGSNGDAKIVINDPYGNFYCVDDSFGTVNPTIDFNNPAGGSYDIWICSASPNTTISGTLYLTENSGNHP